MTTLATESKSPYDMIIEILENTHDGNDLSPSHLKLVEITSNNDLSEAGEIALYELYANVQKGYSKPCHLGVEHMTKDHEGFIYWKNIQVEHYSHMDNEEELKELKELERRCKIIESSGLIVNGSTVIWQWDNIAKTLGVFKELEA